MEGLYFVQLLFVNENYAMIFGRFFSKNLPDLIMFNLSSSCLLWPIEGERDPFIKLFIIVITGLSMTKEPVDHGEMNPY